MKKKELLQIINNELLDKLFGFCYVRTEDSYEAEELCSDILFALVKAANGEGEIENAYPFIWRVAHNVYADFSKNRKLNSERFYEGNPEEELIKLASAASDDIAKIECEEDEDERYLKLIYRSIAFLGKAYREVMIAYYLDGKPTAEIAREQGISETAVRQRLFAARNAVKGEVKDMDSMNYKEKPVALQTLDFVIWGNGNPAWGDPRDVCTRQFSKHVVWLCRNKAMNAREISEKLNVPMMYVEEELEVQCKGENGEYGLLKKLDNGKYITNFVLLDKEEITRAHNIYIERIPRITEIVIEHIEKHKEEYLAFPYLNRKVDLNLVLWQHMPDIRNRCKKAIGDILKKEYFADVERVVRPFNVFGYLNPDSAKSYGIGWDFVAAHDVGGYSEVSISNIYGAGVEKHFACGHNVANDMQLLLALKSIKGFKVSKLKEAEKEHAAKAIEQGYIYREGDMLYTKILACTKKAGEGLYEVNRELEARLEDEARALAGEMAKLIRECVPEYLLSDFGSVNGLASMPLENGIIEELIKKGYLSLSENGLGAEGCFVEVKK